ncbi:uncharacterized protein NPIL_590401 [Nephila pilipes]|uniref:Uncharacterized protein n=1 Tax=Nephila pilipes TaxID=299642 RepID=A0A8X6NPB6_NEPPI|nr:uncharacterized protein NPIL_590401 [Nephila pilipes]
MSCWVRLPENKNNNNILGYLLKDENSVQDTLKLISKLRSLGIKDDSSYLKNDQAMNIFKETIQFNNDRYVVVLPLHKHWNELSDNHSVAKQRFQNLWRRLQRENTVSSVSGNDSRLFESWDYRESRNYCGKYIQTGILFTPLSNKNRGSSHNFSSYCIYCCITSN